MGLISSKLVGGTSTTESPTVDNICASLHSTPSTESRNNGLTPEISRRQLSLTWDPRSPTQEIVRTPIQVEKTPMRDVPIPKIPQRFGSELTTELELATGIDTSVEAEDNGALSDEIVAEDKAEEVEQGEIDASESESEKLTLNLQLLNISQATRGNQHNTKTVERPAPVSVTEANFTAASLKKRLLTKNMPLNAVNRSPLMQLNGCATRKTLKFRGNDGNGLNKENVWND